jgi:hypothetical protein
MEATRDSYDAGPVRTGRGRRPRRRARHAAVLVAVCAAAATLLTPAVAGANGNGQQVSFTLGSPGCGSGLGAVTISGRNQSNQSVTWSGSSGNGQDAFASGWWWVGNITVSYQQNGSWHQVQAYVPKDDDQSYQVSPGVVRVDCLGSWWLQSVTVQTGDGNNPGCINLKGNQTGHYRVYTIFTGYFENGWDGHIAPSGYALGPNGRIVPRLITQKNSYPVCD